jgi:very-short-patch-repair endonuclease
MEIIESRSPSFRPHTALETRVGRVLLRSDFIRPVTQHQVVDNGRFVARFDFAWPDRRVGIECESYEWHSGRAAWKKDTTRFNEVAALGWIIIRATDEDATDPTSLLEKLSGLIPKVEQVELSQKKHEVGAFSEEIEDDK